MILKAIIENKEDQYRYRVRIPQINKTVNDPTGTPYENLYIAQVCILPNCIPNYSKGDVVYVAFEKDSKELPVIVGQFYREQKSDSSTEILTQEDLFKQYILTTQTSQNSLNDIISDFDSTHNISNRNFIDNPWFTINQRGATDFSSGSGYGCDRWKGGGANLHIGSGYIENTSSGNYATWQKLEPSLQNELNGKTCTVSVKMSDGTIHSGSFVYALTPLADVVVFNNSDVYVYEERTYGNINVQIKVGKKILAVKLELGSISTLANDTAPNYAIELMKCKRYFNRIIQGVNGRWTPVGACVVRSSVSRVYVPFEVSMRAIPSVVINNFNNSTVQVEFGSTEYAVNEVILGAVASNILQLSVKTATPPTGTQAGSFFIRNTADSTTYVDLIADL